MRLSIFFVRWRFLLLATLLLLTLPAFDSPAQSAESADGGQVSASQARSTLELLKDDQRRSQLISTLEAIAAAAPTAAPSTPTAAEPGNLAPDSLGAQLLAQLSSWVQDASDELVQFVRTVSDLPQLWGWAQRMLNDPSARYGIADAGWRLGGILVAAFLAELALARLLRRPLVALEARPGLPPGRSGPPDPTSPPHLDRHHRGRAILAGSSAILHRLPAALLHALLAAVPILGFLAVAYGLLATPLGATPTARLAAIAIVNAYVTLRLVMEGVRLLTNSSADGLRLLPMQGETSAYLEVWVRRILATGFFGAAVGSIGVLLGLTPDAQKAIIKITLLLIHIYVVIILLQSRRAISSHIAGATGNSAFSVVRRHLATVWIYPVILLVLAMWFVWALEVRNGLSRLFIFFLTTAAILAVARILTALALAALDRVFRVHPEMNRRYPGLDARVNRYYPVLRRLIMIVVGIGTVLTLMEAWGLNAISWLTSSAIGGRLLSAAGTVAVAAIAAILVWEFVTMAMDRHLATLNREGQYVRAARVRTLLPMLRTLLLSVMLVIVGLTLLSEIGVNIAPLLAGAGILGVAIGFGSQKLVQDFITGIFLLLENAMQVGDSVTVSGLSGVVENLSIRTMRLRAGDGSLHIIPFSSVSTVTNVNRGIGNAAISVTVSAREDTDRVGEVLKEIAAELRQDPLYTDRILADFALWGVDQVDGATATIVGQIPCTDSGRSGVQREFNRRMKKRFEAEGIEIALPAQAIFLRREQPSVPRPAEETAVGGSGGAILDSPPTSALGHDS